MALYKIYSSRYLGIAPEEVNTKYLKLDAKMQLGYKYLLEENKLQAVSTWTEVWNEIVDAMRREGVKTLKAFDKIFNGHQFVTNWINDFDDFLMETMSNSSSKEILERFGSTRIFINEELQAYVEPEKILAIENARRAIAEAYFQMGNIEKSEELYMDYLNEDPCWGWGWISWSDQYWLKNHGELNFEKGEEILLQALKIKDLKDRSDVEERLFLLYSDSKQQDKLKDLEEKYEIEHGEKYW